MQDAKEEVRSRLDIEDVVGEYVQLKRAGRNFKGLSPFSAEKTPSFVVSPDKQIWHDFSSGKGGDVFSFVMQVEGMDFRQALELLARKAGVDLSMFQSDRSGEVAKKKKRLHELSELAAAYYQQSLVHNLHAVEYVFKKRKLSKKIVQDFKIGYAPTSGNALVSFLEKKDYVARDLKDAGVVNQYGGDMFRGRMTVPLMDASGQVIGFTARIIEDDPKAPKYLNTPQTLLYDKSRHVFGLSQAKEAIRKNDYAVIVEGNLDVVSSHQAGICQVVATAGTAMTEFHLKAISRLTRNVRLAFDADKAGIAATERAIPLAQAASVDLTIISLPGDAKDPDELIQNDVTLWQQAIDRHVPALDWLLSQYAARENLETAAGKRTYTSAGIAVVRTLQDAVEQEHYLTVMATATGASLQVLKQKLDDKPEAAAKALKSIHIAEVSTDETPVLYQDDLLAVALFDPEARASLAGVPLERLEGEQRQAVLKWLQGSQEELLETPQRLQKYDTYVKILLLRAENRYAAWSSKERILEAARLLRQIVHEHNKTKKETLIAELRDAENEHNDTDATRIRNELNELIKEMRHG